jgi:hypothetical protein
MIMPHWIGALQPGGSWIGSTVGATFPPFSGGSPVLRLTSQARRSSGYAIYPGPSRTFAGDAGDIGDAKGNIHTGSRFSGAIWTNEQFGPALGFSGNSYAQVPFATGGTTPTVLAWSMRPAAVSGYVGLFATQPGSLAVYYQTDMATYQTVNMDVDIATNVLSSTTLPWTPWSRFVLSWDLLGNYGICLNGVVVKTGNSSGSFSAWPTLTIGSRRDFTLNYCGTLWDVYASTTDCPTPGSLARYAALDYERATKSPWGIFERSPDPATLILLMDKVSSETIAIAATLPKVSASIVAQVADSISVASTLPKITASIVAEVADSVALASTLPRVSVSIVASVVDTISVAATLPKVSAALATQVVDTISVASTLPRVSISILARIVDTDSIASTLPAVSVSIVAQVRDSIAVAATLPRISVSIVGQANACAVAVTLPAVSVSLISSSTPFVFEIEMSYWLAGQVGATVYPNRIPQKNPSYPALVYTLVDADSILLLSGPAKYYWSRIQFDSYSDVYADAANLDASLEELLAPYVGAMGRALVTNATRERRTNQDDTPPVASDSGIFRTMSEWTFWYFKTPYGS